MDDQTRNEVRALISRFLARWLDDRAALQDLDEIAENASPTGSLAPFHDALVPSIRIFSERSFSTRLGNLHEDVAVVIGASVHPEVRCRYALSGTIHLFTREFITQRLRQLEARQAMPDALLERQQIRSGFGDEVSESTTIDLFVRTASDAEHYFEIKAPKANKGQCIEMKGRLLKALAIRRDVEVRSWWGMPYNPYGMAPFRHPYPLHFFDFGNEVLIEERFWDFVGGPGTYSTLLAIYADVGREFAPQMAEVVETVRISLHEQQPR